MYTKKQSWDVDDISRQIHSLARECCNPYTDGFTSFEYKKDLHTLKNLIEEVFSDLPEFGDMEKQWLTELEQKRIIKHLKS